jgi:hypothetical protein
VCHTTFSTASLHCGPRRRQYWLLPPPSCRREHNGQRIIFESSGQATWAVRALVLQLQFRVLVLSAELLAVTMDEPNESLLLVSGALEDALALVVLFYFLDDA